VHSRQPYYYASTTSEGLLRASPAGKLLVRDTQTTSPPPLHDLITHCAPPAPPTAAMANDEYDVSAACDTWVLVLVTDSLRAVSLQGYIPPPCPPRAFC